MTSAPAADKEPVTLAAWLAADLLRVLDELRFGQHGRLPTALREDLDYHAGLLRLRIHRVTHRADQHRADQHRADQHRADQHRADQHRAPRPHTKEHRR